MIKRGGRKENEKGMDMEKGTGNAHTGLVVCTMESVPGIVTWGIGRKMMVAFCIINGGIYSGLGRSMGLGGSHSGR